MPLTLPPIVLSDKLIGHNDFFNFFNFFPEKG